MPPARGTGVNTVHASRAAVPPIARAARTVWAVWADRRRDDPPCADGVERGGAHPGPCGRAAERGRAPSIGPAPSPGAVRSVPGAFEPRSPARWRPRRCSGSMRRCSTRRLMEMDWGRVGGNDARRRSGGPGGSAADPGGVARTCDCPDSARAGGRARARCRPRLLDWARSVAAESPPGAARNHRSPAGGVARDAARSSPHVVAITHKGVIKALLGLARGWDPHRQVPRCASTGPARDRSPVRPGPPARSPSTSRTSGSSAMDGGGERHVAALP